MPGFEASNIPDDSLVVVGANISADTGTTNFELPIYSRLAHEWLKKQHLLYYAICLHIQYTMYSLYQHILSNIY